MKSTDPLVFVKAEEDFYCHYLDAISGKLFSQMARTASVLIMSDFGPVKNKNGLN